MNKFFTEISKLSAKEFSLAENNFLNQKIF
jgi:hypothetical protein